MQHVHARARLVLAAAQPFAVDRDMPEPALDLHENAERRFQVLGRKSLKNKLEIYFCFNPSDHVIRRRTPMA